MTDQQGDMGIASIQVILSQLAQFEGRGLSGWYKGGNVRREDPSQL